MEKNVSVMGLWLSFKSLGMHVNEFGIGVGLKYSQYTCSFDFNCHC